VAISFSHKILSTFRMYYPRLVPFCAWKGLKESFPAHGCSQLGISSQMRMPVASS
jgi:hypothetical protein